MFDTEKFILAVKARPSIWMAFAYKRNERVSKKESFEEIGREMFEKWETFPQRKKSDIVEKLQSRWRNLKDYHMKLRRQDRVTNRKNPHLDLLNFLDSTISKKHSIQEFLSENNSPGPSKKKREESENESDTNFDQQLNNSESDSENDNTPLQMSKSSYETNDNYQILSVESQMNNPPSIQIPAPNTVNEFTEDPDRSFLISILPDIKTMDERQKVQFKLETMKLIHKIKYETKYPNLQVEIKQDKEGNDPLQAYEEDIRILDNF